MSQQGSILNPSGIGQDFVEDSGSAAPVGGVINILGGAGIDTSGAGNTVTIALTGGGLSIDSFTPDSGTSPVVPDGTGDISMSGGNGIVTTGGLNTLTFAIDPAYVGQTSITTLGTVTTGTWNATDIAVADGGTGRSSHTAYAVLCGGTTTTAAQQSVASLGTAAQVLTSNGAGALPTFQDAGGGGVAGPGSSTDNALARWNGTGGDTLQDSSVVVSDDGEMTNASQPSFLAKVSGTQVNVTGDSTTYTFVFNSVYFDQGGDYDNTTGKFTAPVDGNYNFSTNFLIGGLSASHTRAQHYLVTTPVTWYFSAANYGAMRDAFNELRTNNSLYIDLDAGDEAYCRLQVYNGAKTVDIFGSSRTTVFSGVLVC